MTRGGFGASTSVRGFTTDTPPPPLNQRRPSRARQAAGCTPPPPSRLRSPWLVPNVREITRGLLPLATVSSWDLETR